MLPTITMLYASLLAFQLLLLSVQVVRLRRRHQVGIGTGSVNALERAVRAQANFTEYVPVALVLIVLLELSGFWPWLIHALGLALLIGRILHAQGLHRSGGTSAGRLIGTAATWLVILVAAACGIAYSVMRLANV